MNAETWSVFYFGWEFGPPQRRLRVMTSKVILIAWLFTWSFICIWINFDDYAQVINIHALSYESREMGMKKYDKTFYDAYMRYSCSCTWKAQFVSIFSLSHDLQGVKCIKYLCAITNNILLIAIYTFISDAHRVDAATITNSLIVMLETEDGVSAPLSLHKATEEETVWNIIGNRALYSD